jgi:hypothetical protein
LEVEEDKQGAFVE